MPAPSSPHAHLDATTTRALREVYRLLIAAGRRAAHAEPEPTGDAGSAPTAAVERRLPLSDPHDHVLAHPDA